MIKERDYEQVFQDATSLLIKNHPFFGHILANMVRVHTDAVKTMCVSMNRSSQIVLEYNTEMIKKEIEENNATLKNIAAIVKHEIYHVINEHFIRGFNKKLDKWVMTPLGPKRLFPLACDIAINQYIDDLPEWVLNLESFKGMKLPKEESAEIYYAKLLKLAKETAQQYQNKLNSLGQSAGVLMYNVPENKQDHNGPTGMPHPNDSCPQCNGTGEIKQCPTCGQQIKDDAQSNKQSPEQSKEQSEKGQGDKQQQQSGEKQSDSKGDGQNQKGQQGDQKSNQQQSTSNQQGTEQNQQQGQQGDNQSSQQQQSSQSSGQKGDQESQQGQEGTNEQGEGKRKQQQTDNKTDQSSKQNCPDCGQSLPQGQKGQQGQQGEKQSDSKGEGQKQQGQGEDQQSDTSGKQQPGKEGEQQGQQSKGGGPITKTCPSCGGSGKHTPQPQGSIDQQINAINQWLPFDKEMLQKWLEQLIKSGNSPTSKQTGAPGNHDSWTNVQDIPRELVDATIKQAVREAYQKAKFGGHGIGSLPAGIERMCKETLKPAYNFAPFLKRFIDGELYARAVSTRKRPNRRYRWEYPGRKAETKGKIGLLVDSSGSIYDEDISLFVKNIEQMSEYAEIVVFDVDTAIHDIRIYSKRRFKKAIKGGGGTAFGHVFKVIKNYEKHKELLKNVPENNKKMARNYVNGIKALIIMTDGMVCDVPKKEPKYPVMWALTSRAHKAPRTWGKVIYLDNKPEDHGGRR